MGLLPYLLDLPSIPVFNYQGSGSIGVHGVASTHVSATPATGGSIGVHGVGPITHATANPTTGGSLLALGFCTVKKTVVNITPITPYQLNNFILAKRTFKENNRILFVYGETAVKSHFLTAADAAYLPVDTLLTKPLLARDKITPTTPTDQYIITDKSVSRRRRKNT